MVRCKWRTRDYVCRLILACFVPMRFAFFLSLLFHLLSIHYMILHTTNSTVCSSDGKWKYGSLLKKKKRSVFDIHGVVTFFHERGARAREIGSIRFSKLRERNGQKLNNQLFHLSLKKIKVFFCPVLIRFLCI